MLIRELVLVVLLLLHIVSSSDYRWYNAVDFWSNVICSIENCKTVNFHCVLDNMRSTFILQCFNDFINIFARKCETTIISKTYMLQDSENASFIDNHKPMEWSSIWKITFEDIHVSRTMQSVPEKISIQRNQAVYGRNTWNVHVLLARDIRSFDLISKKDSTFEWNSQDRFIVLITHRKKYEQNESSLKIDDILKTLWSERKVHNIFVSEAILVNDTTRINRFIRTYNPFAKIDNSAWGKIEVINVNTVERASKVLSNLIYRRTKNLDGYELKVGILEKEESTMGIKENSTNSVLYEFNVFKSFDETILDTVSRYMNFKAKQIYPTDNESFGYQLPNGTYVGAIGDVVYGRTDVCFGSFFVKKYGANTDDNIEFTTYVEFDRVCIIVPKASKIPKWLRIYHFFPPSVWICSMLSHVFVYITWHFLQIFTPRRKEKVNFLTTVYRSFLLNAGCPQKLPSTNAERILLTGVFLASTTIVGIFNGILYNSFAHDMYYEDIDNLKDLDISGLPIMFTSFSLSDLLGPKNDVDETLYMRNLKKKMQHGHNALKIAAYYRNVSGLLREHQFPIRNQELVDTDGSPLLHLIKECPGTYYLSYLLPKNSILRERINVLIGRLNQAGLPTLWTSRTIQRIAAQKKLLVKQKQLRNEHEMNNFVAFKLSDMQTSFYMLLIGLLLSTIIFSHEKGWLKVLSLYNRKLSFKSRY